MSDSNLSKRLFFILLAVLGALGIGWGGARAAWNASVPEPTPRLAVSRHRSARHPGDEATGPVDAASSHVVYVDRDAPGGNDGSTWSDAYRSLSDALSAAASGDEIWVAGGVYTPTTGITRTATFSMVDGVSLYGGFVGTETERQERDWQANVTVLSGDLDGNDATDARGVITDTAGIRGANAFHVVTVNGVTENVLLDGFTITGGAADGTGVHGNGGAVHAADSRIGLRRVVIRGNCAGVCSTALREAGLRLDGGGVPAAWITAASAGAGQGGGLYALNSSTVVSDTIFSHNEAAAGGGMKVGGTGSVSLTGVSVTRNGAAFGGGLYSEGVTATLTDVGFLRNLATLGGGLYNDDSALTMTSVTFRENVGAGPFTGQGGGLYNANGPVHIMNALFSGNLVDGTPFDPSRGAAVYNAGTMMSLTNATVQGNETSGDGTGGGVYVASGQLSVTNSIVWENRDGEGIGRTAGITATAGSTVTVAYSVLQNGAYGGPGVIDADPRFIDPPGNLHLRPSSPAIDAGENAAVTASTDLDGGPRRVDVDSVPDSGSGTPPIVDMGAYEASFNDIFLPLVVRQ